MAHLLNIGRSHKCSCNVTSGRFTFTYNLQGFKQKNAEGEFQFILGDISLVFQYARLNYRGSSVVFCSGRFRERHSLGLQNQGPQSYLHLIQSPPVLNGRLRSGPERRRRLKLDFVMQMRTSSLFCNRSF